MTPNIEAEFMRAIRLRDAMGDKAKIEWPFSRRVQWGVAPVAFYGDGERRWEHQAGGVMAFVLPVVEGGELIDLCAVDGRNNHWATRMGYGYGLGLDVVAKARMRCCELRLVGTALVWLMNPVDAVYLFDLHAVQSALDGVDVIACDSLELSDRVAALLPPSERARAQVA